jgi:hypothetical protein
MVGMDDEPANSVSSAVERCLAYAAQIDPPLPAACEFIAVLKERKKLSNKEVAEVSRRVVSELGNRVLQAVDRWPGK